MRMSSVIHFGIIAGALAAAGHKELSPVPNRELIRPHSASGANHRKGRRGKLSEDVRKRRAANRMARASRKVNGKR